VHLYDEEVTTRHSENIAAAVNLPYSKDADDQCEHMPAYKHVSQYSL